MIRYFNRSRKQVEEEKVYGDWFIKMLYGGSIGKYVSPFFANRYFSEFYGKLQDLGMSQFKVPKFIREFNINLDEYQAGTNPDPVAKEESYANFNEFFVRKFVEGVRPFVQGKQLPAFAEARYTGVESVDPSSTFPVKGKYLKAKDLLGNDELAKKFEGGPLLIARLCPVDYHRYHYPDNGTLGEHYRVHGEYHSVNPAALKLKQDIFITNERQVSVLHTENFGEIAYIEVGAVCVGKIVQTHPVNSPYKRGEEKGLFLFGGSTVIILGQKGKWKPSQDILDYSKRGMEVYIKLGDEVGVAN